MKTAVRFHRVWGPMDPMAEAFRTLAANYQREIGVDSLEEGSIDQVLYSQEGACDRWLLVATIVGRPVGFVHGKIDHTLRRGLGYLIEFYVVPERRGCHLGCLMAEAMCALMHSAGAVAAWLSAVPAAEGFWERQSFVDTGFVVDGEKILLRALGMGGARHERIPAPHKVNTGYAKVVASGTNAASGAM
ncbi:MAG: hypothetical protein BWY85_01099 [Firmicutes bacterium ADurb.Bin506]|nr:MAG: hypothetical protein BWY85_01099 [Firmicutes bacterium ADurb.Bin506]